MNFRGTVIVVAILVSYSFLVESHFTCEGTCYKGNFVGDKDAIVDKAVVGHSFQNLTVYAPHQCLSACVSNCRCLAFQLQGRACELLDQDRFLTPGGLTSIQGYKYFDLSQTLDRNVSKVTYIHSYTSVLSLCTRLVCTSLH